MIYPTNAVLRRRSVLAGAAGLLAAPAPVLSEALAQAASGGGQSAVIDVNRARTAPIPIAIPDLGGGQLGSQIAGVISNDLSNSGLFRLIDKSGYIQASASSGDTPNFQNWKPTGAQALVTGNVSGSSGS